MSIDGQDMPVNRCANPDCHAATDGKCVEGFQDLETCPQFGKELVDGPPSEVKVELVKKGVHLPVSMTLDVVEAGRLLRDELTNMIAVVGPHDAGKTSLIAGVYDLFQSGPVGNIAFASSLTLHSFERVCHDARAASRRAMPHTERTNRGEVRFYHLELADQAAESRHAMLLADRSGEEYSETRDDPDSAAAFYELIRADTITMLVDGAKLLDNGQRHNVHSEVQLTLQAFVDGRIFRPWQRIAMVLTKVDAIRNSDHGQSQALEYFEGIVRTITQNFGGYFAQIVAFQVAASPKSGGAERGEGLPELLNFWLMPGLRFEPKEVARIEVVPSRAFGRLQFAIEGTA